MRESKIEAYLKKRVEETGGECYKWTGFRGATDRIVMWPRIMDKFVETKAPRGRLSVLQRRLHTRLTELGREVFVLWTIEHVDLFIDAYGPQGRK